jgi:hypothetical protein
LANLELGPDLAEEPNAAAQFEEWVSGPAGRAIEAFVSRNGILTNNTFYDGDVLKFDEPLVEFERFHKTVRDAWRGENTALQQLQQRIGPITLAQRTFWCDVENGIMITRISRMDELVCLFVLRDYASGLTGVCANADCPTPHFVRERADQQFCSHKCAVRISVRKFRERKRAATGKNARESEP